jgi:hypothetical protein
MESDKFFSQFDTFQACLSCTFPCLFLVHCLSVKGHDSEAEPSVQEECSREGRNEHGECLCRGQEKAASKSTRGFAQDLHLHSSM